MAKAKETSSKIDISKRIEERVREFKLSDKYNPRKEQELSELYQRFVPPSATTETTNLIDVAERDAYVHPFPPIDSNKKGGVLLKKGIRVGFGWYAQFLSQQISTFGSGVARSLRALNSDVIELKKKISSAKVPNFVYSLDLSTLDTISFENVEKEVFKNDLSNVVVSDSIDNSILETIAKRCEHLIVVDKNPNAYINFEAYVDVRNAELIEFLKGLENASLDLLILSGSINFVDVPTRLEILALASSLLSPNGVLLLAIQDSKTKLTTDKECALEIMSSNLLSAKTYERILQEHFLNVVSNGNVFICSNGSNK